MYHLDCGEATRAFPDPTEAAAELIREGKTAFSPIAHSHAIARFGLPWDWRFWERHDRRFLEVCDEIVVVTLDGWQENVGVKTETEIARGLERTVTLADALG